MEKKETESKVCGVCGQPTELCHAITWGVSGRLLGCNTYFKCPACQAHDKNGRSTLSPCGEKHLKPISGPSSKLPS